MKDHNPCVLKLINYVFSYDILQPMYVEIDEWCFQLWKITTHVSWNLNYILWLLGNVRIKARESVAMVLMFALNIFASMHESFNIQYLT